MRKQVYEIIILPPDDKFRELPTHISEWIDDEDEKRISSLDTGTRREYVQIMQTILNTFEIRHPSFISDGITEIGNESIHLKDLITKFGKKVGEILFEELASSWELKTKKERGSRDRHSTLLPIYLSICFMHQLLVGPKSGQPCLAGVRNRYKIWFQVCLLQMIQCVFVLS